jgi:hypothetical protein
MLAGGYFLGFGVGWSREGSLNFAGQFIYLLTISPRDG